MRFIWFIGLLFLPLYAAADLTFALIPKAANTPFFNQVKAGCEQAAKELGITCLFIGPKQFDIRQQNMLIEELIEQKQVDGIALSVSGSSFLAERSMQRAMTAKVPVVTFDSDFAEAELQRFPNLRHAYIGTDNYAFGAALAQQVLKDRPNGGSLCVISGHELSPNMQSRIDGLRDTLQGLSRQSNNSPRLQALNWTENSRCPLYSRDDIPRSMTLLQHALQTHREAPHKLDTLVALGAWPQFDANGYRAIVKEYLPEILSKDILLVIGDTLPQQLTLLEEGLAHSNVGQNAFEMGRLALHSLYKISQGDAYQPIVHTPLTLCIPGNTDRCTR